MADLLRALWCRIAHPGRETLHEVSVSNGVRTEQLVSETCLTCGRRVQ